LTPPNRTLSRTTASLASGVHEGQIELATLRERRQAADERARGLERALATALEPRRNAKSQPAKSSTGSRRVAGGSKQAP